MSVRFFLRKATIRVQTLSQEALAGRSQIYFVIAQYFLNEIVLRYEQTM